MDRYIVVSPHTVGDCAKVIKEVGSTGYITRFDWGCKGGEHTGWAIIEADNEAQALMAVPSSHRRHAKAIRLVKITPEEARTL